MVKKKLGFLSTALIPVLIFVIIVFTIFFLVELAFTQNVSSSFFNQSLIQSEGMDPLSSFYCISPREMSGLKNNQSIKRIGKENPLIDLKTGKCLENCQNSTGFLDFAYSDSDEKKRNILGE